MKNTPFTSQIKHFLDLRLLFLTALIQVSSLRNYFVASSIPNPPLTWAISSVTIYFLLCLMLWLWKAPLFNKLLSSWILTIFLLLIIWAIGMFMYARMEGLNKGGTGDDAMEQPILAMMQGKGPYDVKLFDNAPISPGLGWLLLNAPFTIAGISSLLNVFYMGCFAIAVNRFMVNSALANMSLLAIMLCFSAWEQIYSYHDLLVIGFAFTTLFILGEYFLTNTVRAILLGILTGVISTSRLIFIFIPFMLAFINYKNSPQKAFLYGLVSGITAIGIHLIGYSTSTYYQPLHILGRGVSNIPLWIIGLGGIATGITFLQAIRYLKLGFQNRLLWFSLMLLVPLIFISIGELIGNGFDIKKWEAAHYLLPVLPSVALLTLIREDIVTKKK